jgi:hypothetical protein
MRIKLFIKDLIKGRRKMKKISRIIIAVLVIQLTMSFTKAHEWYLLQSKELGFKIEFPVEPTTTKQQAELETGAVTLNIFMYDATKTRKKDENLVYMVMMSEYPDMRINSTKMNKEELKNYYKNAIGGAVKNVHGKQLDETIITLNGYEGRQVRIDFNDGLAVITLRLFLIKNKMYMLQTITETKKDFNFSIKRFMDSFYLL